MSALIAVVGGFASGIFFRSLFFTSWWPVLFILLMTALVGAFGFLKPRREYSIATVFLIFVALGMVRSAVAETPLPTLFAGDLKHRVAYEGVVVGDPDIREKSQRIALVVEKGDEKVGALAVMPLKNHVAIGDRVRVYGTLSIPQAFETENGRTFRYDKCATIFCFKCLRERKRSIHSHTITDGDMIFEGHHGECSDFFISLLYNERDALTLLANIGVAYHNSLIGDAM